MPRITQELVARYVADNNGLTGRQIAAHFNTDATLINRKYDAEMHSDVFPTTWKGIFAIENIVQVDHKHYIKSPVTYNPHDIEIRTHRDVVSSTSEASSDDEVGTVRKEESDLHGEETESIDLSTLTPADHTQRLIDDLNEQLAASKRLSSALSQDKARLVKSVAKNTERENAQVATIALLKKEIQELKMTNDKLHAQTESSASIIETKDYEFVIYHKGIELQAANSMAERFKQEKADLIIEHVVNMQKLKAQNKNYKIFIFAFLLMFLSIIIGYCLNFTPFFHFIGF